MPRSIGKKGSKFLWLVAAVFLTTSTGWSQVRSGRISGAVHDSSGANVADAKVEILETATGQRYPGTTNGEGEFQVPYLPGGTYEVKVVKQGFISSVQSGIPLGVSETVRIEVILQVGGTQTVVNVTDSGGTVQTESSSIVGVTGTQLIQALPNVNHNPLYFATLQLGATPRASMTQVTGQNSFGIGINGRRNVSAIAINGGGAFQNDVQVDGVGVVGSAWNEAAVLPNSEGLQEVRTTVNNYSAEYGRGQGVVLMTTKSGTNEFHGSGFWRHRNDFFNANSFSNNARKIDRPGFKVHTYGGTFGGPAIRNKAFFFASWEGLKFNEGLNFLRTVPTILERKGDFSQTLSNVSGVPTPLQLFDPYNVIPAGTNVFQRAAIPNSVIPANRLNAAALMLASQYPMPNGPPDDVYNTNNFRRSATRVYGRNNLNSRFDYRAGEKHSLYFTGGFTFGDITHPLTFSDDNLNNSIAGEGFSRFIKDRNPYFSVGDTF
ncbi:MAG: carboxypeptidase regulatory-like domain-containing protein, partial [Bryobacteraceae bacterium]|nr:carboxypeptidase regulatory-like domain-containing protein [Bryobacteraceae bacterium]